MLQAGERQLHLQLHPHHRTTLTSDVDATRYSNSAVFPIPGSPRSTTERLSPRRESPNQVIRRSALTRPPRKPPGGPGAWTPVSITTTDPRARVADQRFARMHGGSDHRDHRQRPTAERSVSDIHARPLGPAGTTRRKQRLRPLRGRRKVDPVKIPEDRALRQRAALLRHRDTPPTELEPAAASAANCNLLAVHSCALFSSTWNGPGDGSRPIAGRRSG